MLSEWRKRWKSIINKSKENKKWLFCKKSNKKSNLINSLIQVKEET